MVSATKGGRKVQFGIFDWIERDENSPAQIFEDRLKLLEYADKQDFFCYHLAEHHTTPLSVAPSPGIFLSAAAQRTSRIRLGPLVFLLPLYNPLRLIQEVCMLDHLSHGRLELGVGRGIVPYEVARFGTSSGRGLDGRVRLPRMGPGVARALIAARMRQSAALSAFHNIYILRRPISNGHAT